MGILGSSWDDPKSQGLLALAAGMMQGNMGKGVADMSSTMAGAQDVAMKRRMAQLAETRAQATFDMQQDAYRGIGGASSGGSAASGLLGVGAPSGAVQSSPGGDTNAQLVRLEKMAIAGVPGAKEAFEIYKYRNDPQQLQPGTFSQNRVTGKREYIPDVKTAVGFDERGMYALPGSDVLARLEGDKQRAIESAKAGMDFIKIEDGQGGTQQMPRTRAATLLGGGAPAPAGYASEPQMRTTANSNMGADPQSAQREIARATADLQKLNDPESRKQLTDYIAELKRQSGNIQPVAATEPRWGASLSPEKLIEQEASRVKAVDQVKADVQPTQAKQASIDSARNAYDLVTKVLDHPGIGQATGLSGTVNPANYIPGTDAKNFNVLAKQLKGNVFLSAYAQLKGSGSITEIEGGKAEQAIARMDQSQSTAEYKQALKDYQSIMAQGLKRMGVNPESQWGSGNAGFAKPESSGLSLSAPNGKTYTFKSEQEMKNFKMSTGLK